MTENYASKTRDAPERSKLIHFFEQYSFEYKDASPANRKTLNFERPIYYYITCFSIS